MPMKLFAALLIVAALLTDVAHGVEFREAAMLAPLPEGVSSFGATVDGDQLYSFSGHIGRIPGNSIEGLSPHFGRLDLSKADAQWESLPMHVPSQSPGLVAWNGKIYRVGGLSFKNHTGEEAAFQSLDIFAKFDPATKTWTELPKLPVPRSSLDAAVLDGKLYVVGGWNLQQEGSSSAVWHDDALVFDLADEKGSWKKIAKPPFVKRALAVVGHNHKLYAMGGMTENNSITKEVNVYDPATQKWSLGPELRARDQFGGFAISAFSNGDSMFFSGSEGIVYRLDGAKGWVAIERLAQPRSFHRLVATKDKVVALAGVARGGGYSPSVEAIDLSLKSHAGPKLARWSIAFPGETRKGQASLLIDNGLYLFGGNRSRESHDFDNEDYTDEAFRLDLAARTAEKLPALPQPVQGGAAVVVGSRNDQSIYVVGGHGPGDGFTPVDTAFGYRTRSKAWSDEVKHLPVPRAMFRMVEFEGGVWIFGGSETRGGKRGLATEVLYWSGDAADPIAPAPSIEMPVSRRSFGAARIGELYYLVGGLGSDSNVVTQVDVFNLRTKTWSKIPSPQTSRVFSNLAVSGGKLYLFGGSAKADGKFASVPSIETFDPKTNTWSTFADKLPFDTQGTTLAEYQGRLLFTRVDPAKDGVMQFVLLDPTPESEESTGEGSRAPANDGNGQELIARLMRMDKNADGKLTKDEVGERFQPLIARADADKDGAASKHEIEATIRREAGTPAAGGAGAPPRGSLPAASGAAAR